MARYRKIPPVLFECEQWQRGDPALAARLGVTTNPSTPLIDTVLTPEGVVVVLPGDWIVKSIEGERRVVKDADFPRQYEIYTFDSHTKGG